jgi:nitroreductase
VVTDPEARAIIAKGGRYGKFLDRTPALIVAVGDAEASAEWYAVDTAIALEHIALAAVAEGLGSCWIGSFDEAGVKQLLSVPEGQRIVALLALGYPKERIDLTRLADALIHPGKAIDRIACEGSFDKPWKVDG